MTDSGGSLHFREHFTNNKASCFLHWTIPFTYPCIVVVPDCRESRRCQWPITKSSSRDSRPKCSKLESAMLAGTVFVYKEKTASLIWARGLRFLIFGLELHLQEYLYVPMSECPVPTLRCKYKCIF